PRNEIRKLEMEIWELKVKGTISLSSRQQAKGNWRIHQQPLGTNNNNNTRTKGRTLDEFTPQHLWKEVIWGIQTPMR
nr:hypothetical protein [Tanacetum cinerariifolium]